MRPFWLQQALDSAQEAVCPPLQGDARCDVCIVGGGYTGLWTALMLKEAVPALDIVLIEADICGAGASGRNGGCALSWSAKYFTLERLFGVAEAVRLVRESERSIGEIGAFCAANGIDCDYRLDGTLYTATNAAQVGATDAVIAALEQKGINSFRRLPLPQVQRLAGSARHLEGWFSPAAATVQPGKLVRGLRRVALQRGVRIHEGTAMTGLEHGAPGAGAHGPWHGARRPRGIGPECLDGAGFPAVRTQRGDCFQRHGDHRTLPRAVAPGRPGQRHQRA